MPLVYPVTIVANKDTVLEKRTIRMRPTLLRTE